MIGLIKGTARQLKTVSGLPLPIASYKSNSKLPIKAIGLPFSCTQSGSGDPYPAGGGKNLFNDTTGTHTINANTATTLQIGNVYLKANTTYTISCKQTPAPLTSFLRNILIVIGGGTTTYNSAGNDYTIKPMTFTPTVSGIYSVMVWGHTLSDNTSYSDFQVEKGSQATDYAPYSNIRPITGVSSVNVTRAGKNLWSNEKAVADSNTPSVYIEDGVLNFKSGPNPLNYYLKCNSQVVLSCKLKSTVNANVGLRAYYSDGTNTQILSVTLTANVEQSVTTIATTSGKELAYISSIYTDNRPVMMWDAQLELGSQVTSFSPYTGNTYTIDLDGTRYGGTIDIVDGNAVMTVDRVEFLPTNTMTITGTTRTNLGLWAFTIVESPTFKNSLNILSSINVPTHYFSATKSGFCTALAGKSIFVLTDEDSGLNASSTAEDIQSAFRSFVTTYAPQSVYELATPFTVNLGSLSVPSLLGQNNIWQDAGNIDILKPMDRQLYYGR